MIDPQTNQRPQAHLARLFYERFGSIPEAVAAAPGRVNLIGEHTDYNHGFVLPMAINRACRIAAAPNGSNEIVVHSADRNEEQRFSLCELDPAPRGNFADYVRGVVAGFCAAGASVQGFNALIASEVPQGSGLSSSAALEVATATVLEQLCRHSIGRLEKALICQRAEHEYVGVPCGLMDQYSSVFGRKNRLILLDCRSNQSQFVPFDDPDLQLLVINTKVRHQLADSQYVQRRQSCERAAAKLGVASLREVDAAKLATDAARLNATELKRARHVVAENDRTLRTAAAVRSRDWPTTGEYLYCSHKSLRDDYEVSCPELDVVVDICRGIGQDGGVFGARMTGGGFGGCAIALVRTRDAANVRNRIAREYLQRTEIQPSLFAVRPGPGARALSPAMPGR